MKVERNVRSLARFAIFGVAMAGMLACAKVDSGFGGVMWTAFGGTQEQIYPEGWYAVAPWNKMWVYNVRTQDRPELLHILASNGLSLEMDTSIRFRVKGDALPLLHKTLGPTYYEVLIASALRSEARKVGGRYSPEEIYSTKRSVVEKEIFDEVARSLADRPIVMEAILVRNVDLPDKLKNAINEKLEEEQRSLKMEFTLSREKQEAMRKGIEAKGIAERNRIINESISPNLLQYEGIGATERLANSANSKIVVIGNPKNGLPVIMSGP